MQKLYVYGCFEWVITLESAITATQRSRGILLWSWLMTAGVAVTGVTTTAQVVSVIRVSANTVDTAFDSATRLWTGYWVDSHQLSGFKCNYGEM